MRPLGSSGMIPGCPLLGEVVVEPFKAFYGFIDWSEVSERQNKIIVYGILMLLVDFCFSHYTVN